MFTHCFYAIFKYLQFLYDVYRAYVYMYDQYIDHKSDYEEVSVCVLNVCCVNCHLLHCKGDKESFSRMLSWMEDANRIELQLNWNETICYGNANMHIDYSHWMEELFDFEDNCISIRTLANNSLSVGEEFLPLTGAVGVKKIISV